MLGDLGEFNIGLSSKGTETAEDFNPLHHIKAVRVNWTPGENLSLLNKGEVFYVLLLKKSYRSELF